MGRGENKRGVTLVELIVVISVMAILSALIVPQFSGSYQGAMLGAAGREIAAVAALARSQAITTGRPHRIAFEPESGRYRLEAPDPQGDRGGEFAPTRGVPGSLGEIDGRIRIEIRARNAHRQAPRSDETTRGDETPRSDETMRSRTDAVLFRPDGTAEGRDIVLRDADGFALLIEIQPVTARVRIAALGREVAP